MVVPLGDMNPTRRTPWVTWLLIAINVGVFVVLQPWAADACTQQRFFLQWAPVPAEVLSGEALDAGQLPPLATRCGLSPVEGKSVWAAILFGMFLHGGWLHLLFNMLYLGIFGNNVEDRLGHLTYLGFYLLVGVVATLVFMVPNAGSTRALVGASGAVAGVLGAYLVLYPRARVSVWIAPLIIVVVQLPAIVVLGLWFVLQISELRAAGAMAGGEVAYLAHVAGFLAGAALVLATGQHGHGTVDSPPR